MTCLSVIVEPHNEGALANKGLLRHGKKKLPACIINSSSDSTYKGSLSHRRRL